MAASWSRRDVVRAGAALGVGSLISPAFAAGGVRRGDDTIRVGVIGCGGRGTGAAANAIDVHPSVKVVALADLFSDRVASARGYLLEREDASQRVDIPEERCFAGFDAYQKLLAIKEIDYVCLATPPGFRPIHFKAAIDAGKNVFLEKPVAVDPAGVRTVIEAGERARQQKLSVVAGTQRRHEASYLALMDRVKSGEIGDVVAAQCYWNQGGLWVHERKPEYTDMEWQCRNWLYFCWLSGDHICEQHVHNIDVINWAKGGPPVRALGMGGRQVRTQEKYGDIFDHFAVEFEYADGMRLTSMCRQIDGCDSRVEEVMRGTKGSVVSRPGHAVIEGASAWRFTGENRNPYEQEHVNLIASMRGDGVYFNEAKQVAESTLTAIMGRMSAYTGKEITWEQAMGSKLDYAPGSYAFGDLAVGAVPTPGQTPLI